MTEMEKHLIFDTIYSLFSYIYSVYNSVLSCHSLLVALGHYPHGPHFVSDVKTSGYGEV